MNNFTRTLLILFLFGTSISQTSAQTVTVSPVNSSYKTGYAFNASGGASRNDGNMLVNWNSSGNSKRGYVVFNLSSVVPTGATITSATLRFTINTVNTM